jgi:organic radical activating enzyme
MGRYSITLKKTGPTCNPNNPCSGKYGKCLDIKIINTCNGNCPFCIEAKGFIPKDVSSAEKLAESVNGQNINTLLILGGEPLLYPDIVKFVFLIRKDINIIITTNGSMLTPDLAKGLTPYVKGMNISIHHSTSAKHRELTKIDLNGDTLYKSVQAFGPDKIRINCNLVKGYVDSTKEINAMYDLTKRLGVTKIKFAELQNCPALFVDASTLFSNIPSEPFEKGCEITIPKKGMEVIVRVTCGIIDRNKPAVVEPSGRNAQTQIMYNDMQVVHGWLAENGIPVNSCHVRNNPNPPSSGGGSCSGGAIGRSLGSCS